MKSNRFRAVLLCMTLAVVVIMTSCGGGGGGATPPAQKCGNGAIDTSEKCDGTLLNSKTCVTQGFDAGTLSCNSTCTDFVTTSCTRTTSCGDGTKNGNEECDLGTATNTNTACTPSYGGSCTYCDTSCKSHVVTGGTCGDNEVTSPEQCDLGAANTNTACVAGRDASCTYCDTSCQSHTVQGTRCGDGTQNGSEQCDQGASNTNNACTPPTGGNSCTYCDTSCVSHTVNPPAPTCGNGTPNTGEGCDNGGSNTNTACSPPYNGNCSYCDTSCNSHTLQGSRCGDNTLNSGNGETCDQGASNTNTACSPAYGSSCNYCNLTCILRTVQGAYCGDNAINGSEVCDLGANNTNTACSAGYGLNCTYCDLTCHPHTVNGAYCGDGTKNGPEGCDSGAGNTNTPCTAPYNQTCNYCNTSCVQNTVTGPRCGDGTVQTANGETCDGSNLNGQSCSSLGQGFTGGSLSCTTGCAFNTSACTSTPAYVSQHYSKQVTMPDGGNPRGVAIQVVGAGYRVLVADSVKNVVVVFDENLNQITTIPSSGGLIPETVCSSKDGKKIFVGGGGLGKFAYLTYPGSGNTYAEVGKYGTKGSEFDIVRQCAINKLATAVFVDDDTTSLLTSSPDHRYWKWTIASTTFNWFVGTRGSGAGQFNRPWGIVLDSLDNIFVSDLAGRIQKFDSSGTLVPGFSIPAGSLTSPAYLGIDANDRLYAMNSDGKIKVFSSIDGSLQGIVNTGGSSTGNITQGIGVAVAPDGKVFATDQYTSVINMYIVP